jgi:DNA-binding NarL/FixJ family response regulator
VVLLDWQIIASAPAEYIKNLHLIESQPQVIVLCIRPEIRREVEDAGADVFISKDTPPDELLLVLHNIEKDELEGKR